MIGLQSLCINLTNNRLIHQMMPLIFSLVLSSDIRHDTLSNLHQTLSSLPNGVDTDHTQTDEQPDERNADPSGKALNGVDM